MRTIKAPASHTRIKVRAGAAAEAVSTDGRGALAAGSLAAGLGRLGCTLVTMAGAVAGDRTGHSRRGARNVTSGTASTPKSVVTHTKCRSSAERWRNRWARRK